MAIHNALHDYTRQVFTHRQDFGKPKTCGPTRRTVEVIVNSYLNSEMRPGRIGFLAMLPTAISSHPRS